MSFHEYTKKGFFIVFIHQKIETQYEETRCTNTDCKNNKKEITDDFKFCPLCGSKIDWVDVTDYEYDSFSKYDELEIPTCGNEPLHDWFYSPEFIGDIIDENWCYYDKPQEAEILLCNRDFDADMPADREAFMNHPATKYLLKQLKTGYEVKYGLVSYSA